MEERPIQRPLRLMGYLSGADATILRELPPFDYKPYLWIGCFNLLGSIVLTASLGLLAVRENLSQVVTAVGLYLAVSIIPWLRLIVYRQLINNWSKTAQFFFFLILITGSLTPLANLNYGLDPISKLYRDHAELRAKLDSIQYSFRDDTLRKIASSQYIVQEEAISNRIDSYLVSDPLRSAYFFGSRKYLFNTLSVLATIVILLCDLFVYLTVQQKLKDLYHDLLEEKQKLSKESLEQERNKIREGFRNQIEISQKKSALTQIQKEDGIDRMAATSLLNKLEENTTVSGLIAVANVEAQGGNHEKALQFINQAIEQDKEMVLRDNHYRQSAEIYELKGKILKQISLFDDAEVAERQAVTIRDENSFLDNRGKKIVLEKLVLNDVSIFDNFVWSFKPGVNVLLGKNGYGKSHLFGLLITLLYDDKKKIKDWVDASKSNFGVKLYLSGQVPGEKIEEELASETRSLRKKQSELDQKAREFISSTKKEYKDSELEDRFSSEIQEINLINGKVISLQQKLEEFRPTIQADANTIKSKTGRIPVLAIPDSRFISKNTEAISVSQTGTSDFARNGAKEFLYGESYSEVIGNALFQACVSYFENGKKFDSQQFGLIKRIIQDLSTDKLVSKDGQLMFQDESKFKFISIVSNEKSGSFSIKAQPEDSDIVLPLQKISQGTFSVLAITCLIYNFLKSIYQDEENLTSRFAIVVIDELDAHIHPSWQRKLIAILRRNFPAIQFIISAHSPLLIQGCKANEVSVLRRTVEGKFKIETINRSLIGFSIENIHSLIFEIENKDLSMLRYNELAPYLNDFQKELDELLGKEDENPSLETIDRISELKDLIAHIDVSKSAFEKVKMETLSKNQKISAFLKEASQNMTEKTEK